MNRQLVINLNTLTTEATPRGWRNTKASSDRIFCSPVSSIEDHPQIPWSAISYSHQLYNLPAIAPEESKQMKNTPAIKKRLSAVLPTHKEKRKDEALPTLETLKHAKPQRTSIRECRRIYSKKTERERICKASEASRSAILESMMIESRRTISSLPEIGNSSSQFKLDYNKRAFGMKTVETESAAIAMTNLNDSAARMLKNKQIDELKDVDLLCPGTNPFQPKKGYMNSIDSILKKSFIVGDISEELSPKQDFDFLTRTSWVEETKLIP